MEYRNKNFFNGKQIIVFLCLIFFVTLSNAKQQHPKEYFDISLNAVPIRLVFSSLSRAVKKNLVIDDEIHSTVSVNLYHVTYQEALKAILVSKKLLMKRMGSTTYIDSLANANEFNRLVSSEQHHKIISRVIYLKYAQAPSIAKLLQKNITEKETHILADKRTNSIIVYGQLSQLEPIEKVLKKIDIPARQVLIKVRIASIDFSYERTLGIKFKNIGNFEVSVFKGTQEQALDLALSALETEGKADIIAAPNLLTTDRQAATIESGEEIPYQQFAGEGVTSTAFKKAVLRLLVTPHISPNHQIVLQLQVNQDKRGSKEINGVPTIDTHRIKSEVVMQNGQTVVLGGIYEHTTNHQVEKIPFFSNIPLLGVLFRHQKRINNRRELLIFVTPKIVSNDHGTRS